MTDRSEARAAKAHLVEMLSNHSAVNGVGMGRVGTAWVLRVNLRSADPALRRGIPTEVDGVPVHVQVVGPVRAAIAR